MYAARDKIISCPNRVLLQDNKSTPPADTTTDTVKVDVSDTTNVTTPPLPKDDKQDDSPPVVASPNDGSTTPNTTITDNNKDNTQKQDDSSKDNTTLKLGNTPAVKAEDTSTKKGEVTLVVSDETGEKGKDIDKQPEKGSDKEPVPINNNNKGGAAVVTSKKTIDAIVAELQEVYKDPCSCVKSTFITNCNTFSRLHNVNIHSLLLLKELGWDAEGKVLSIQLSTEDRKSLRLTMVLGDDYPHVRPVTLLEENSDNLDDRKAEVSTFNIDILWSIVFLSQQELVQNVNEYGNSKTKTLVDIMSFMASRAESINLTNEHLSNVFFIF